jgi:hypothetical protein
MAKVEESVQALETLCQCAASLSSRTQGRPTSDWRLIEGSIIFAGACLTSISLLRLIPLSSLYRPVQNLDAWDLPLVASLVRNIIETYHVLFYVTETVSESECEAREALWRFHETAERLEMLRPAVPSSAGVEQLKREYAKRKARLESSLFFQSLSKKQRMNLLSARDSKFSTKIAITNRAGVSRRYLASCYKYCSNFTHSSPMAVAMMNAFRAGTPEGRERFKYVSELATAFMALMIRDFVRLVPDQSRHIDQKIRDIIRIWEGVLKEWDRNQ